MTKSLRLASTSFVVVSVLALVACGGGDGETGKTPSSAPTHNTAKPTTAEAPTSTSSGSRTTAEVATRHAKDVAKAYFRVSDACMSTPKSSPMTCFDKVAITTELTTRRNALASAKAANTRQVGASRVVSLDRTKIDLTNRPKKKPASVPEVVLNVCYDVSKVNVVDYNGKSIVPSGRVPRGIVRVSVVNYKYPSETAWKVGLVQQLKGRTC